MLAIDQTYCNNPSSRSLGSVTLGSGRDTSQAPFPSFPEGNLQHSLLSTAAMVVHEITSCTKGAVGMKNVDAA